MKSMLTSLYGNFIVDRLKSDLTNPELCNTFITIGHSKTFGNSADNVESVDCTTNFRNGFYSNMVGMKKVYGSDLQPVVSRIDWAANTTYDTYEDHINIFCFNDYQNLGRVNSNANTQLSGTVNIASSGSIAVSLSGNSGLSSIPANTAVVGTGTSFTTYIFPGDKIVVNSEIKSVVAVTNATFLIVNSAFANTNTSGSLTLLGNSQTVIGLTTTNFVGNVQTGNVIVIGDEARQVVTVRSNKVISLNVDSRYSNSNVVVQRLDNTFPRTANTFYVRNNRDQVFKCLFNGNNSPSTVEPTVDIDGQLPENPFIVTGDGYRWKYMYTIPPGLKQKFFTKEWMPVVTDDAVRAGSEDGRIDIVKVLWGGSGYFNGGNTNTGSFLSVTNTDGSGARLLARVANGNITSVTVQIGGNNYTRGTITANNVLANRIPSATLVGTVNIDGSTIVTANSSSNANAFIGNVYVNDIVTINGYSRNVVSVVNNTSLQVNAPFIYAATDQTVSVVRSNAIFDIQIGPSGGHGSNPAKELRAHSLMLCVELNDDTDGQKIPISDSTNIFDFNQVGILVNPLIANSAWFANLTNYRTTTRLLVSDPVTANFINDETVYIGSTLSSANAVANVAHWAAGDNYLYINNITGSFPVSATVKSESSGISTPILGVANSEIKPYSGDLIYVENRPNIVRKDNQIDQVKIVLSF